jgi:hypothetical protein
VARRQDERANVHAAPFCRLSSLEGALNTLA